MEQRELIARIGEIIETEYKHQYYDHNVALYREYLALTTGVGTEDYLQRFSSRETEARGPRVTVK